MAKVELPTTQRAYTLRLRGTEDGDTTWRDALWATHEAVNKGAKVFGDWLLTLRGGLDHRLADDGPAEQRKDRRILLALSWLSVEDTHGAPGEFTIAKPVEALRAILTERGLDATALEEWMIDCSASLSAQTRDDASWVNRSAAFDGIAKQCPTLTRNEIWDFLEPFFVNPKSYLLPKKSEAETDASDESASKEEKAKDLIKMAGGWLSKRMGSGKGANFSGMSKAYEQIAVWANTAQPGSSGASTLSDLARSLSTFSPETEDANGVLSVISGPGHKSATQNQIKTISSRQAVSREDLDKLAEWASDDAVASASKIGGKGPRPYSDMIIKSVEKACGFTYLQADGPARHCEFSVMLDHAARRVNVNHSWTKNAEAERRQFEADARRIGDVSAAALTWLEAYCASRKDSSGALEAYRIRKRAIDGWEQVIEKWSRAECKTLEDRIKAARDLQDDPDIDKFGDIQLFEALADEKAECAWKSGDTVSAQPLKDFVFATDAMAKRIRFKVPAYRHPDPLRHPVFTDFGYSRWNISFAIHERLKSAAEGKRTRKNDINWLAEHRAIRMKLWNGKTVDATDPPLFWSSKRMASDLSICKTENSPETQPIEVSRADRLGRAAAGAGQNARVTILGLFNEKEWNGRLQAPRAQLDALARQIEKHGWDAKVQTMVKRIRWLLSFSAKLTPKGPWTEFAKQLDLKPEPQYWPHAEANKQRQSHARLILSRLPGLRVLSVDLGHRFAAACAVWEAITIKQMNDACKAAGFATPAAGAMYVHLRIKNAHSKELTTIYRRIGSDTLPDGSAHPAPWARLDRQFLIKLQGEDRPARKASPSEFDAVKDFDSWAGRLRKDDDPPPGAVDELMQDAVGTARLALARHGRRARIAHNLTATTRIRPGGIVETHTEETRLKQLIETLSDWHALATDDRWNDLAAKHLWNLKLANISGGFEPKSKSSEEISRADRKKEEADLQKRLEPLAKTLIGDSKLTKELHDEWTARWKSDDWDWQKKKLKWLSRWLMPRGISREIVRANGKRRRKTDHQKLGAASRIGGLSLIRLGTLTEFRRKVQVGFFNRMKPDGSREEIGKHFGQSTLDAIEKLKDNRVKQLASRIVEAALGVGIERGRDMKRPRERINDPRFAPCHAVVIEDLTHYRPEETRTRRENRATMDWKSAEARKRLEDHCQLHGLHLRDVNPQYTSRQDSRTGAPGWRCQDIGIDEFLKPSRHVTGAIKAMLATLTEAQKKPFETATLEARLTKALELCVQGNGESRNRFIVQRFAQLREQSSSKQKTNGTVRISIKSGDLFVSADLKSPAANGMQADLNAAANIGLRALMDPDFSGKWWYVPSDPKTKAPKPDKVKGSAVLTDVGPLSEMSPDSDKIGENRKKKAKVRSKEVVNLWRDAAASPILGTKGNESWSETPAYWNLVQWRVVKLLRSQAGLPPEKT